LLSVLEVMAEVFPVGGQDAKVHNGSA
jgi:hypothetical protein